MTGPWDSPNPEAPPQQPAPIGFARGLLLNLRAGFRLARFTPVARGQFVVTPGQALMSGGIAAVMAFAYTLARWQHVELLGYALESGWVTTLAASCLMLFVAAYAISVFARGSQGFAGFCVIATSALLLPIA